MKKMVLVFALTTVAFAQNVTISHRDYSFIISELEILKNVKSPKVREQKIDIIIRILKRNPSHRYVKPTDPNSVQAIVSTNVFWKDKEQTPSGEPRGDLFFTRP